MDVVSKAPAGRFDCDGLVTLVLDNGILFARTVLAIQYFVVFFDLIHYE